MKILHGNIRTNVRVEVDEENATPENSMGYEHDPNNASVANHGDSTFSIDPDGTLYIYGDRSKPAHHSYGPNAWLHVSDETNCGAFNTAHETKVLSMHPPKILSTRNPKEEIGQ